MYRVDDTLYFGRLENGDVRLVRFRVPPPIPPLATYVYASSLVHTDVVIPASVWPSVVASVSACGEYGGRFYTAQAFHMNPPQGAPR